MKQLLPLLFLLPFCAAGQTLDPVDLFNYLNKEHEAIAQRQMEYLQYAVHSSDLALIAKKRLALLEQIKEATARLEKLPSSETGSELRAGMQDILKEYATIFQLEFSSVEQLKENSNNSFEAMEAYLNALSKAEANLAAASESYLELQRAFAKQHNMQLIEGADQSQAKQINALNTYQRSIFLPSFRINIRNNQFLDALERKDAPAMTEARTELLAAAEKSIPNIQSRSDFNGNTQYRDAVLDQLIFIEEVAKEYYGALIAISGKPEAELTAKDVSTYNEALEKINTGLNPRIEASNNALQELLRANVPKPATRGTKRT